MVSTRSTARAQDQSPQGSACNPPPSVTRTPRSKKSSSNTRPSKASHEDAGQRPVRRKFQKASLEENHGSTKKGDTSSDSNPNSRTHSGSDSEREERVGKKRSFDEVNPEGDVEAGNASRRGRKRSRSPETETTAQKKSSVKGDEAPAKQRQDPEDDSGEKVKAIAHNTIDATASEGAKAHAPSASGEKNENQVRRKRSRDDLEGAEDAATETAPKHVRKRSKSSEDSGRSKQGRESHVETSEVHKQKIQDDGTKPDSKRKEESTVSSTIDSDGENTPKPDSQHTASGKASTSLKVGILSHTDETQRDIASGLSSTGTESPSSSVSGSKSPKKEQQTSSEAFASSGFASFVSQSPFASVNSSASPFAAAGAGQTPLGGGSAFGATAKPSPFGAQSGFGQLGGSIGSKPLFGGKLSAFGSSADTKENDNEKIVKTTSKSKEIAANGAEKDSEAATEQDEDSENEDEGLFQEAKAQDSRFYEQDVETGEEEEETRFEARAKLFVNTGKEWKERGVGLFKVNVMEPIPSDNSEEPKPRARFIMRADGTHRVSINSPITPEVQVQDKDGAEPKGNTVIFMGAIDGKMKLCLLRLRNAELALDLYDIVQAIKRELL